VVYFNIPFPGPAALLKILKAKTKDLPDADLNAIIAHFNLLRNPEFVKLRKKPATAELIFWAELLPQIGFNPQRLTKLESLNADEQKKLLSSYTVLAKTKEDHDALRRVIFPDEE